MDRTSLPVELLVMFREEVRDNVQLISSALHELEAGAAAERVSALSQDIGRRLHNIKGAASSLGLEPIASVAHAAETLLLA
ncbi:MAG TPA: Hpt domain-containing protein, partial [Polyangiaceae bacterium]